nr:prenylcysteine oxidase 1-like [Penaeus vannamei]
MCWPQRLITLCILWLVLSLSQEAEPKEAKRLAKIAVIGGGIGGTAAAYFLKHHFGDDLVLHLYESHAVGGRLAVRSIAGNTYEIGGAVIHPENKYMKEFTSKYGLSEKEKCLSRMGIFDGDEYVFQASNFGFADTVKLFWRYGWDVHSFHKSTKDLLKKFNRIYDLQGQGQAFSNVSALLKAVDQDLLDMTHLSVRDWFKKNGYKDNIIDELVTAVTKCNYGQNADIHALVGAIAVAGGDPNLWSVKGGNMRVAEELLKHSHATLLKRKVKEIMLNEDGNFMVTSVEAETSDKQGERRSRNSSVDNKEDKSRSKVYDLVVVATPLTKDTSGIQFVNFTKKLTFPGRYEEIFCTMVQGKLCLESVKLTEKYPLDEILVTKAPRVYNSISRQTPTDAVCSKEYPDVWKIFSGTSLTEEHLNVLFNEWETVHEVRWFAYPHYDSDQQLGDFELHPGLYHLNAIEWAGSAMEMSCIGAKNVALLALKHWLQDPTAGKMGILREEL